MEKTVLVANEVAELLRVDKQRVYELTRRGLLPTIKIGERQYRYSRTAIEQWLAGGGNAESGEAFSDNVASNAFEFGHDEGR